jgi:hypothetical protein
MNDKGDLFADLTKDAGTCGRPTVANGESMLLPQDAGGEVRRIHLLCSHVVSSGVRGPLLADVLIAVDAYFLLMDGDRVAFAESSFPVAELAYHLHRWVARGGGEDFVFDSMSFDEPGLITIRRHDSGWVCSSVLTPENETSPVSWAEIERCVLAFVAQVAEKLERLGIDDSVMRSP